VEFSLLVQVAIVMFSLEDVEVVVVVINLGVAFTFVTGNVVPSVIDSEEMYVSPPGLFSEI
jgi:hypothetical protein